MAATITPTNKVSITKLPMVIKTTKKNRAIFPNAVDLTQDRVTGPETALLAPRSAKEIIELFIIPKKFEKKLSPIIEFEV